MIDPKTFLLWTAHWLVLPIVGLTLIAMVCYISTRVGNCAILRERRRRQPRLKLTNNNYRQWSREEKRRDSYEGTGRPRNA